MRRVHLSLLLAGAGCVLPPPVGSAPPPPNLQESRPPGAEPPPLEFEPAEEARSNGALLRSPLLDLRHEQFGAVLDLLLEAAGGEVGPAVVQPNTREGLGVFLPREKWIWDGPEHRFLARLTRDEIDGLELQTSPIDEMARVVEGDPVPLEPDPFENREIERFSGKVTRVEDDAARYFFFELKDPENHYRRIFVAPRDVVTAVPALDQDVEVEGVPTRDERGALWIAASLTVGEHRTELRNAEGRIFWPRFLGRLKGRWLSARKLLEAPVRTADGHDLQVRDLWLEGACERAAFVVLRVDAISTCAVHWSTFSWTGEGPVQTSCTLEDIRAQERTEILPGYIALVGDAITPPD